MSLARWKDIWLHEGFASYLEWLWAGRKNGTTTQEIFDETYQSHPADAEFWTIEPGDPGPFQEFHEAVYDRGAMAVHQLRRTVGDEVFFPLLRRWVTRKQFGNATIAEFRTLAEQMSGKDLRALFQTWLYTPRRPPLVTG